MESHPPFYPLASIKEGFLAPCSVSIPVSALRSLFLVSAIFATSHNVLVISLTATSSCNQDNWLDCWQWNNDNLKLHHIAHRLSLVGSTPAAWDRLGIWLYRRHVSTYMSWSGYVLIFIVTLQSLVKGQVLQNLRSNQRFCLFYITNIEPLNIGRAVDRLKKCKVVIS